MNVLAAPLPGTAPIGWEARAPHARRAVIGRERRGRTHWRPGLTRLCCASMRRWPPPNNAAWRLLSMRSLTETGWLQRLRIVVPRLQFRTLSLAPAATARKRIAAAIFFLSLPACHTPLCTSGRMRRERSHSGSAPARRRWSQSA